MREELIHPNGRVWLHFVPFSEDKCHALVIYKDSGAGVLLQLGANHGPIVVRPVAQHVQIGRLAAGTTGENLTPEFTSVEVSLYDAGRVVDYCRQRGWIWVSGVPVLAESYKTATSAGLTHALTAALQREAVSNGRV
jgi:hypothetical protein